MTAWMRRLYWNRATKPLLAKAWLLAHRKQVKRASDQWQRLSDEQKTDIVYRVLTGQ